MNTYDNVEYQEYEEGEEEYESGSVSHMRGGKLLLLFAWFLLCAGLMYPANLLHLGFTSLIFSMAASAFIIGAFWLIVRFVKHKLARMQLTGKQWLYALMGQTPPEVEGQVYYQDEEEYSGANVTRRLNNTTTNLDERSLMARPDMGMTVYEEEDEERLPESIIEENGLYLADNFMPAIEGILGQIILIFGVRRFGKSNMLAALVEEMARFLLPMLIVDTDDEYSSLANRQYMPRGFLAGSVALQRIQPTPLRNYIIITTENAFSIGQQILQDTLQVVFNMKSYDSEEEAAFVLCEIIRGMEAWETARPNAKRIPCFLFMDEASKWLPEDRSRKVVSAEMQARLFKTFSGIVVNRGGKQGFGCVFAAQRIQDLSKSLMQAPWKFLFYQASKVDLEQYKAFGLDEADVLTLRCGECFIFSPMVIGFRTFIRKRFSPHGGNTPGLDGLKAHHEKSLRPVNTVQFHPTIELPEQHAMHRQNYATATKYPQETNTFYQSKTSAPATTVLEEETVQETTPEKLTINKIEVTVEQYAAYQLHTVGRNTTIALLSAAMTQDGRFGTVDTNRAYAIRNQLVTLGLLQVRQKQTA